MGKTSKQPLTSVVCRSGIPSLAKRSTASFGLMRGIDPSISVNYIYYL